MLKGLRKHFRPKKLLVFLLLGATINVAVAWAAALASDTRRGIESEGLTQYEIPKKGFRFGYIFNLNVDKQVTKIKTRCSLWITPDLMVNYTDKSAEEVAPSWGRTRYWGMHYAADRENIVHSAYRYMFILDEASGWPMLCLWGGWGSAEMAATEHLQSIKDTVWSIPIEPYKSFYGGKLLPLQPIWPGFAMNTIFYAAIIWLLVAAPFKLRRFMRMKRQRCPGCGYPWGGGTSTVCTECGVPVTRRAGNGQWAIGPRH